MGKLGHGEAWIGTDGLVVVYTIRDKPLPSRDLSRFDRNVVDCAEEIGGKLASIRMLYAGATTAPGQHVTAIWQLRENYALTVRAFHPDSSAREEMLDIVRSVRFRAEVPGLPNN
jgi:hypothetical protein